MDFTVYPNTRIARLPAALRGPALLARNLIPDGLWRYRYPYRADELATVHLNPFLEDPVFEEAYARISDHWRLGLVDKRWRLWVLTRLARTRAGLPEDQPGHFAEFGVFRGGCAHVILSTTELAAGQRYFLFDTFKGFPADHLTEGEVDRGLPGAFADTSIPAVEELLARWHDRIVITPGDIFETLEKTETGSLTFVHLDLNGAAAMVRALEYVYPRLVPGGIAVLDDYGADKYTTMRQAVGEFLADKPEDALSLPTAQAVLIKR
jgi:O-methyltransferase